MVATKRNGTSKHIRNILVIEDDEDTRFVIRAALEEEGYGVRGAVDRDEAIKYLSQALYQVIVMDICMPGKSAPDFVRMVRKVSPTTKIIVLTAVDKAADVAMSLGLNYSIGKPLQMEELLALLERLESNWN